MAQTGLYFFRDFDGYDEKAARKNLTADAKPILTALESSFAALSDWNAPAIHEVITTVAGQFNVGLGKVAQPLRVAVCGGAASPPIDATLALLGMSRTIARLKVAQNYSA
jgi:glutamyl-tRNA synthetase